MEDEVESNANANLFLKQREEIDKRCLRLYEIYRELEEVREAMIHFSEAVEKQGGQLETIETAIADTAEATTGAEETIVETVGAELGLASVSPANSGEALRWKWLGLGRNAGLVILCLTPVAWATVGLKAGLVCIGAGWFAGKLR